MPFPIHTMTTAPKASQPILERLQETLGVIPNMAAAIATSPPLLQAFAALRAAAEAPTWPTSSARPSDWPSASPSTTPMASRSTPPCSRASTSTTPMCSGCGKGNRLAAVYTYARSLAVNRGAIDDAVRAEAWYAGIDHRLALDITTEATFATLIGYVDALTERVELDGFLADNAWVPTAA
jgi:hypothetical protein